MRVWPRGVRARQHDGFLTCNVWAPAAAPSRALLTALHRGELTPATFMLAYVAEVVSRVIEQVVEYHPDAGASRGWRREQRPILLATHHAETTSTATRVHPYVLDWLGERAADTKLTLLCFEARPPDPVEEVRGLYCHRVALARLVGGEPVDSVTRHYRETQDWERAREHASFGM